MGLFGGSRDDVLHIESRINEVVKNQKNIIRELADIKERTIHIEDRLVNLEEHLNIVDDGKLAEVIERLIHIEDRVTEISNQESGDIVIDFKKM